jgi:3'-phosphoadenosine 5'-phosphosulfate sulfotransferase (PAPS reductase)/FAD synthetase
VTERYALFSGGEDSLVATHRTMTEYDADGVIYLDTSSSLPDNDRYVRETCEELGWELEILEPTCSLKEFAKNGFPKAASHSWAYRYFKGHALGRFTTQCDGEPIYTTGVYKAESERRFRNIEAEYQDGPGGRWKFHAIIHDWTEDEIQQYIEEHDLPRNPVVEDLGRSGDCFCLAFDTRDEALLDLRANGYEEHADWLLKVEEEVQDELGTDEEYCWIGSEGLSSKELRAKMAEADDVQQSLCASCGMSRAEVGGESQ